MSETKRGEPFVAWAWEHELDALHGDDLRAAQLLLCNQGNPLRVPVTVTPMLTGDPKIGETWIEDGEREVRILGPVTVDNEGVAWVETSHGICDLPCLTRPPMLRTYRHTVEWADGTTVTTTIKAKSKDDAVGKLGTTLGERWADALEEVKP